MKSLSKFGITLIFLSLSTLFSEAALAVVDLQGKVTTYHLNGNSSTRDACIRMTPKISSPSGWACLLKTNGLRTQISTTMREAFEWQKNCRIQWSNLQPGTQDAVIDVFECGNFL
jgi:hypothetical protein